MPVTIQASCAKYPPSRRPLIRKRVRKPHALRGDDLEGPHPGVVAQLEHGLAVGEVLGGRERSPARGSVIQEHAIRVEPRAEAVEVVGVVVSDRADEWPKHVALDLESQRVELGPRRVLVLRVERDGQLEQLAGLIDLVHGQVLDDGATPVHELLSKEHEAFTASRDGLAGEGEALRLGKEPRTLERRLAAHPHADESPPIVDHAARREQPRGPFRIARRDRCIESLCVSRRRVRGGTGVGEWRRGEPLEARLGRGPVFDRELLEVRHQPVCLTC